MDFLKRDLAPLTDEAWSEIMEKAGDVIKSYLSTRKVFKVVGPKGLDYTAISEGRLKLIDSTKDDDVKTGIYNVKPLVETRITFELDRWEMDNLIRGVKDVQLDNLEEAAKKIALFEEEAVYKGFEDGQIAGLEQVSEYDAISFGNDGASIMEAISKGYILLRKAFADTPMTLIVGDEIWKRINMEVQAEPLMERITDILKGEVVYSPSIDGAFLVPYDHDDLELTIGQDFAVGYEHHDSSTVKLFITESFTFRALDPSIIVKFS